MDRYKKTLELIEKYEKSKNDTQKIIDRYLNDKNRNLDNYEKELENIIGKKNIDFFKQYAKEKGLDRRQYLDSIIDTVNYYNNISFDIDENNDYISKILTDIYADNLDGFIIILEDLNDIIEKNHMLKIVKYMFFPRYLVNKIYVIDKSRLDRYRKELYPKGIELPSIFLFQPSAEINPVMYHYGNSLNFIEEK